MPPASIKDIVPGLVKKIGVTEGNYALLSLVERELSSIGHGARIVAFRNNRVYVEVETSVHLYEYSLKKGEILKAVRGAFGSGHVLTPPEIKFFLKGTARPTAQDQIGRTGGILSKGKGKEKPCQK